MLVLHQHLHNTHLLMLVLHQHLHNMHLRMLVRTSGCALKVT
jgi:hypothetical protein